MVTIAHLIAKWKLLRASLTRRLEILESGKVQMVSGKANTTKQTIFCVKARIADLDALQAEYSKPV